MTRRLLATTAICGVAFFAATPAYATCSNPTPTTGQTVNCTTVGGTDTVGVSSVGTNITVNVQAAASVLTGAADAISIGDGAVSVASGLLEVASAVRDHRQPDVGRTPR